MNIKELTKQKESETLEFKASLGEWKEVIETISALANTRGGKIIIGVSKSGKLLGIQIGKDTIERITNQISQNTDPKIHPRVNVEKISGKSIVVIEVKESSGHLVLAFGRPFKRVGKSTVRISKDEYERLILEKHRDKLQFDKQICRGTKLKDVDEEKVKWFLEEAKRERKLKMPSNISVAETLMRLNLIEKGNKLTNASILLFGKDPQRFFPQAEIKCIRFKGNKPVKPFIDMRVISGNIIDQVEMVRSFILEHIPKAVWLAGKSQREERYQYPPDSIREAIVNAICHRDYKEQSTIQVRIFDDYLEIWNPGILPTPLTLADLKKVHKSVPRNPLIAKHFFWIKFVEEVGTGTNDMIDYCRGWNIPDPEFKHLTGDFVVAFKGKLTIDYLKEIELNERQIKVVEYLKIKGEITNKEYREIFPDISSETIRLDLSDLVKRGFLEKIGKKRGTHYVFKYK